MTTLHDNDFNFVIGGLTEVSFQERDHSISDGQPYEGVSCSGTTLTVKAGRHNSGEVAKWFNSATTGGGGIALTYADTTPDDLNFAVRGTLALTIYGVTYTAENFIVGQGSTTTGGNNWWLGSATMSAITHSNPDMDYLTIIVKDTLAFSAAIVTNSPVGYAAATAKIILSAVQKLKVGSGEIGFTTSNSTTEVELLLFQVADNSNAAVTLTGNYTSP